MTTLTIIAIAVALAIDAFAVAVASGVTLKVVSLRQTFRLSWHFGLFQALMTLLGWLGGMTIRTAIERFDHWIAFGLLLFIGGRMLVQAIRGDEDEESLSKDPTKGATMIMLSVATSIDALAVGLGMSMLENVSILWVAFVIGIVALLFTVAGLHIGKIVGRALTLDRWAQMIGGMVLIGIGLRILHEHGALSVMT